MTLRVVTLPKEARAANFAERARNRGASILEVRDDLTPTADVEALSSLLPILYARRSAATPLEARQLPFVRWHDIPVEDCGGKIDIDVVASHHAPEPLSPDAAERLWASTHAKYIKHVEPLGPLSDAMRLFETQQRLIDRFGEGRVTVLATGPYALPFRILLARRNAFDYLALDNASASAQGQRLLADAVRADRPTSAQDASRLAIIGSGIEHSRSPRIHPAPFDRWDLPPDAPVVELVQKLKRYYRGFAVTAPFKHAFSDARAINTLVRTEGNFGMFNTDVEGAKALMSRFGLTTFTALGDGGATWALKQVAGPQLKVVTASQAGLIEGDVVWTWPEHVPEPAALRFKNARVFLICYGPPARRLSKRVLKLGGVPVFAGPVWFVAQAREQRRLWNTSQ